MPEGEKKETLKHVYVRLDDMTGVQTVIHPSVVHVAERTLLQGHPRNLEPLPTVQVTPDQNKKIHRVGAKLKPRTTLG
jgi:hypothetical protein